MESEMFVLFGGSPCIEYFKNFQDGVSEVLGKTYFLSKLSMKF